MKKLLALMLALMMVLCFAACGGSNDADEPTGITDKDGNEVSQETIEELAEAYNAIAIPYNEIATTANENGWMADEQTAAELNALSTTLGFIGTGLSEDLSMLDGSDFEALINKLETEFPEAIDILSERVSVPYES